MGPSVTFKQCLVHQPQAYSHHGARHLAKADIKRGTTLLVESPLLREPEKSFGKRVYRRYVCGCGWYAWPKCRCTLRSEVFVVSLHMLATFTSPFNFLAIGTRYPTRERKDFAGSNWRRSAWCSCMCAWRGACTPLVWLGSNVETGKDYSHTLAIHFGT